MKKRETYSYTILRYVHDPMTSEFVNVGVVLYVAETGLVQSKLRSTIGRLKGVFPNIERSAFVSAMNAARRSLKAVATSERSAGFLKSDFDASGIAKKAIPADDSSLQWSPCGTGLTDDVSKTLDRLYERFVTRYDAHSRHRKSDDDVWRPVRQKLEERDLAKLLHEKSIQGSLDEISFKHAWKNGQWHVYEPLSFDLVDADGIKSKAREWLGHITAVVSSSEVETFKAHFVVGAPLNPNLEPAYKSAIAILRTAPNQPDVFEETELDRLIEQIEDDVRAHARAAT